MAKIRQEIQKYAGNEKKSSELLEGGNRENEYSKEPSDDETNFMSVPDDPNVLS